MSCNDNYSVLTPHWLFIFIINQSLDCMTSSSIENGLNSNEIITVNRNHQNSSHCQLRCWKPRKTLIIRRAGRDLTDWSGGVGCAWEIFHWIMKKYFKRTFLFGSCHPTYSSQPTLWRRVKTKYLQNYMNYPLNPDVNFMKTNIAPCWAEWVV